jgi:hypothetical protein
LVPLSFSEAAYQLPGLMGARHVHFTSNGRHKLSSKGAHNWFSGAGIENKKKEGHSDMGIFRTLSVRQHDTIIVDAVGAESARTATASICVEHLETGEASATDGFGVSRRSANFRPHSG